MGKKKKVENNSDSENKNKESLEESKIDFYKGFSPSSEKNLPFPAPNKSEPRVYIEEEVFKEIQTHATETTSVELCGVLIGEVRFDVSGNYLYVCCSIRGEKAKNSGVNVSFTPDTWDYIHEEREKKYPEYSIIGWYHTHPGFGIFLSDMDKFIQDNFFNMPYQIALVVDPKTSQNGIFAWQEGLIRPLKKCWIGKDQLSLTLGTVGGEETYREETESYAKAAKTGNSTKDDEISNSEKSYDSFYKHAFYYFLCFNIAFLFANFLSLKFVTTNAITAAQTEAKDIIASWAMNQAFAYELDELSDHINQMINNLPASASYDVNTVKQFAQSISNRLIFVSNNSKAQGKSASELLKKIANRNIAVQEQEELKVEAMKHMVAATILMQIDPYLKSLSAQPLGPTDKRIKDAKNILDYILVLCTPEQQNAIKQSYPWIFQN